MKKTSLYVVLASLLVGALALPVSAADKSKEITLTGEGKCAKCSLKEAAKCQNALQVQENGKTVTYYLEQNKVSKDFHDTICENPQKITVTGKVKDENGKKVLTASKIALAK